MDNVTHETYITHNGVIYEPFIMIYRKVGAKAHRGMAADQFYAKYLEKEVYDHLEAIGITPMNAMAHLDDETCKEIWEEFNQGA